MHSLVWGLGHAMGHGVKCGVGHGTGNRACCGLEHDPGAWHRTQEMTQDMGHRWRTQEHWT